MNIINKQLQEAIEYHAWDNGSTIAFYRPEAIGSEGELVDAVNDCEKILEDVAIQYGLFRSHMKDMKANDIVRNTVMSKTKEETEQLLFQYFKDNIYVKN